MSEPTVHNNDLDSLIARIRELEARDKDYQQLKHDVKEIKNLTVIGNEIADEVKKELAAEVASLKNQDIVIPFLDKQVEDVIYPKRGARGKNARPLLESEILEAQKNTISASQAAKHLGVSYPTYRKYCLIYNIFKVRDITAKRPNISPVNPYKGKYPLPKLLNGEYPDFPIHRLKDKIIRAGIKKAECEQCGYKERRLTDGKIPLLLNFDDGDKCNHKLSNLQILCYNCTFVSGRGYIKRGTVHFNMDPDILQGAKYPIKPRF